MEVCLGLLIVEPCQAFVLFNHLHDFVILSIKNFLPEGILTTQMILDHRELLSLYSYSVFYKVKLALDFA